MVESYLNTVLLVFHEDTDGQDVGEVFDEDIWERILYFDHSSSFCAKHGLIQFKFSIAKIRNSYLEHLKSIPFPSADL